MKRWTIDERTERLRQFTDHIATDLPPSGRWSTDLGSSLERLRKGERLLEGEAESLEVGVVLRARPALAVGDGAMAFDEPWEYLALPPTRDHLVAVCAAVGQLETSSVEVPAYCGTAFLIAPDLAMTTRHVAELFASGAGVKNVQFRPGHDLRLDFGNGAERETLPSFPVASVSMIHPFLDIALLRLAAPAPAAPLSLWSEDPGALEGRAVAVIGFPRFDPRYGVELQKAALGDVAGVKRVMPGKVLQPRLQRSLGHQMLTLTHDCITLGGRSGAPVVDLETGRVVGVSFASFYLDANFAIPISELARDPRVWELGLRFDNASWPTTSPWQEDWTRADGVDAPSIAAQDDAHDAPPPTAPGFSSVRPAVERLVAEHLADPGEFRRFLVERDYGEVVRAVPERADSAELLRALDRRGLLDEAFLQSLAAAVTGAAPADGAGLSPWLPKSMLSRVTWALEPLSSQNVELYTVGSPWRDYLLDENGMPERAAAIVERLAYDSRPEIQEVLTWLLRRLYESIDTNERDRLEALHEAVRHLEGSTDGALDDAAVAPQILPEPPSMQAVSYLSDGIEAARGVVLVKLLQTAAGISVGSSGWLLTPDLVVVPAHVLSTRSRRAGEGQADTDQANARALSAVVVLDFNEDQQQTEQRTVSALVLSDPYLDLAVLRLQTPVTDRSPLRVRPDALPPALTGLATIHHARLGPKQISRDGRLLRTDGNDVLYQLDTAPGSAGAPIFDDQWRVIAIHRAFTGFRRSPSQPTIRAKLGTSVAALLSRLRDRDGQSSTWREVVAAQPALKTVNVNIVERLGESQKVPLVLRLLDGEPLGDVPGFHLASQTAEIVTGLCDGAGLKALTNHPKVLSIELSKPTGAPECAISVPHIGAHIIHRPPLGEAGDAALIGIIDSGIDVCHRAFCDEHGRTRIVAYWDQHDARSPASDVGSPAVAESPEGEAWVNQLQLGYGALYLAHDIDQFLAGVKVPATFAPAVVVAHGTIVAGIAAGRRTGESDDHFAGGVAPGARLVVVRYDLQDASVGYSKGHIDALKFIGDVADIEKRPVVVNISNGMNAGAHDGTSPLERLCNSFTDNGQKAGRVIVKSAGNERGLGRHARVSVPQGARKHLRWRSLNKPGLQPSTVVEEVEIWFHHLNRYRFRLKPPNGSLSPFIDADHRDLKEYLSNDNLVSAELNTYRPENGGGFLNIKIAPGRRGHVEQGEWGLEIEGVMVPQHEPLDAWVELMSARNVYFQDYIDDRCTITIPGTAEHVISVGAVEVSELLSPFELSSWGPTRKGGEKPELVAPGVALFGPGADRGDRRAVKPENGTSMAAPHVTGAIALALSACVKAGREPHSSFRIRGALQETARPGTRRWNEETGYGALDAEAFFLNLRS